MKHYLYPLYAFICLICSFMAVSASDGLPTDTEFIEKYDNRSFDAVDITTQPSVSFSQLNELSGIEGESFSEQTGISDVVSMFETIFGKGDRESEEDKGTLQIIKDLTPDALKKVSLPAGIFHEQAGFGIRIAIIKAYFAPEYIQMDMLAEITWPGETEDGEKKILRLGAWNIRSYYDNGWPSEVKFALLKDAIIPINNNLALSLYGSNWNPGDGTIDLSNATYFNLDCNGIEHATVFLRGKVKATGDNLKIYNASKNANGTFTTTEERFEIDFNVETSLNSLYFELATEPHYFTFDNSDLIVGMQGFTLDFDVNKTNQGLMQSVQGHVIEHFNGSLRDETWQGLYVNKIELYFPEKLTSGPERFKLNSYDLVIDERGIALGLSDENIQKLNFQKNLPVNVTKIALEISQSKLNSFNIEGAVSPAFLEKGQNLSFGYSGTTVQKDITIAYDEKIQPSKPNTSFIPAEVHSFGCTVTIPEKTSGVDPTLTISMELATSGKLDGLTLIAEDVVYNLHTNSFVSGTASVIVGSEGADFNEFPISGSATATFSSNNRVALDLEIILSTKGNEAKIGGKGSFTFNYGPKTYPDGDTRFVNSLTVSEIQVLVETKAFAFEGGVRFYDPLTDGGRSGFSGNVAFALATKGDLVKEGDHYIGNVIEASASVDFGSQKVENGVPFNYWSLTASVIGFRADIIPGALVATGAAIAVANRMQPVTGEKIKFTPDKEKGLFVMATLFLDVVEKGTGDASFFALFGKDWNPLFLGFIADFNLMVDASKIVDVTALESKLSSFAGNDAGKQILGKTNFTDSQDPTTELSDLGNTLREGIKTDEGKQDYPKNEAHVKFSALIQVDFEAVELQVSAKANLQVGNVISGNGNVYLFASKGKFYIHAGYKYYDFQPFKHKTGPIKQWELLTLKFLEGSPIEAKANASAYFLMGNPVPTDFPTLQELGITTMPALGVQKYNTYNEKVPDGGFGAGIGFGIGFQAEFATSQRRFVSGSGSVYAGALFSFMQYRNVQCKDFGNNFGINKWYGKAQAFAGINATVNAKVGFGKFKKNVEVADVHLGTFLRAEFPNPSWFYGTASGSISILGAFEKSIDLPIEIGDRCTMVYAEDAELNIDIIKNISTAPNKEDGGSIYTAHKYEEITVDFNYKFNVEKKIQNFENPEKKKRYILKVEDVGVKTGSDSVFKYSSNAEIQVVKQWDNKNKKLTIKPKDGVWGVGPGKDSPGKVGLKIFATAYTEPETDGKKTHYLVTFEEDGKQCTDSDGKKLVIFDPSRSCTYLLDTIIWFKVKGEPKTLIASNVVDSWPIIGQKYFFINQTDKHEAYLKIQHQDNLFKEKTIHAEIKDKTENTSTVVVADFKYGTLSFPIENLKTGHSYAVNIINYAAEPNDPSILFSYEFGTSEYENFAIKVQNMQSILSMHESTENEVSATCQYGEPFDAIDLYGSPYSTKGPLVTAFVVMNGKNTYYLNAFNILNEIFEFYYPQGIDLPNNQLGLFFNEKEEYMQYESMRTSSVFPFTYNLGIFNAVCNSVVPLINNLNINGMNGEDVLKNCQICQTGLPSFAAEEEFPVRLQYAYGDESKNQNIVTFKYKPAVDGTF